MNPSQGPLHLPLTTAIITAALILIPLSSALSDTAVPEQPLPKGGTSSISGHVLDSDANPVTYACISVYDASSGNTLEEGYSDQHGYFDITFPDAPSEQIKVRAKPYYGINLIAQFYDGKLTMDQADVIEAPPGSHIAGIDFFLATGGIISGQVRYKDGLPATKISVHAYSYDDLKGVASTASGPGGHYNLVGLPSGEYVVEFDKLFLVRFVLMTGYYDNKAYLFQGDPVPATAGVYTTDIDYTIPTLLCDLDGSCNFEPDPDLMEFAKTIGESLYPNIGDFDYDGDADGMDIFLMTQSVAYAQGE